MNIQNFISFFNLSIMRIKDISKFRTYWKEKEGFNGFDENFMGTQFNGKNGFYRIVNGTVHDIKSDLTPKLQNAQDEQAIYEFLQNAADSNSSNCAVIYDEDYFMVINNGIPFSVKDVEAILNSFQGTKADKTQKQNCDKIGRYGIGFKLVHRLVGKSDGAKELIENLDGPSIFSWFNEKQFYNLVNAGENTSFVSDVDIVSTASPWLFKISLTCFPSMPNEKVKGLDYSEIIAYNTDEFYSLKNFLNKHKSKIEKLTLEKGSLFFLKFGENKHHKLEESLQNINSGIGFSLNTLTLDTVILQEEIVNKIPIEKIEITIHPDDKAFRTIDPEFPECPIDIIFGYRPDEFESLKNASNIYQFFPMRNESHGLAFFIHATSFAKVTDRTKLDDQGESNIHTFEYISIYLKNILKEDLQVSNKNKSRHIFQAIMLSEISQRQNSELVVNKFLIPLIDYFKDNIPTIEGQFLDSESVIIKGTKLDINPIDFGVEKQWFFWGEKENKNLIKEVKEKSKLGLKKWNVASLIENGNVDDINGWIEESDEEDINLLLEEIENDVPSDNFFTIKFLKCSDGNFYSLSEIGDSEELVCLFEKVSEISDILNNLGLITTEINISDYTRIKIKASEKLTYLKETNENEFFDRFISQNTEDNKLSSKEKERLFHAIESLSNISKRKLKDWILFRNNKKELSALEELISPNLKVESWLEDYQINSSEYFEGLDNYLVQQNEIYPSIIYKKWEEIISKNSFGKHLIDEFYTSITRYYNPDLHKGKFLTDEDYIFCNDEFLPISDVFFNKALQDMHGYTDLASAIEKVSNYKLPDKTILKFLTKYPFKTEDDELNDYLEDTILDKTEAYQLLQFCKKTDYSIFKDAYFSKKNNELNLIKDKNIHQYYSHDNNLVEFIEEHLSESYIRLPVELEDFKQYEGILKNQELYEKVIDDLDGAEELTEDLLPLLKHKDIIKSYLSELTEIRLDISEKLSKDSFEYLVVQSILQYFEEEELEVFREKFLIVSDGIEFILSDVSSTNEVNFTIDDKLLTLKISEILPDSDNFAISELLELLLSQLRKLELPKSKLDNLFSIETDEDNLKEKIATDLIESIKNKVLETSDQIAFVLFYQIEFGWENFSEFKVYALDNKEYGIEFTWYVKNYSFLDHTAATSDKYKNLSRKLRLNEENPIFKYGEDCLFLYKPTFDDEGKFLCDYLDDNLSDEKCKEFFDYLFNEYNSRGKESKRDFEEIDDWSSIGDAEMKNVIGVNPNYTIVIEDCDYITDDEKPPSWLIEWSSENKKKDFLNVLGFHGADSDILKLRESLIDSFSISVDELLSSNSLNSKLLENTLEWMISSELWENKWIMEADKIELLNFIVRKLDWDELDYWKIDGDILSDKSEEWDETSYEEWKKENDESFEIYLFKGKMPYKFIYEDYVIAEKNERDYWFDEDEERFYCNSESKKSIESLLQVAADDEVIDNALIKILTDKGLEKIKKLERENQELKRKNKILENAVLAKKSPKNKNYEEDIPTSDDLLDNTDEKTRISVNEQAQRQIFEELKSRGYKVPNDISIRYTIVDGIINPNGNRIKIVTKSAQKGTIYFNPSEWLALSEDDSQLFVLLSGQRIYNITIDDLIDNNDRFHMRFNTEKFAVDANLKTFAELVRYLPETHFLFKVSISTSDFFEEFGLNNRNPSSSDLSADDKNLLH